MTRTRLYFAAVAALLTVGSTVASAQDANELAPPAPPPAAPAPAAPQVAPAPQAYAQPQAVPMLTQPYLARAVPRRERPIVGYRNETRNPPELWGTGLGLFLAGYVLDFAILTPLANLISDDRAGADEEDAWAWSLLPFAGPVIQLAIGAPHPAIPIVTGLMQVTGLVLFIVGLTEEETRRIPVRAGDPEDPSIPTLGLDATPLPGGGALTVSLQHL